MCLKTIGLIFYKSYYLALLCTFAYMCAMVIKDLVFDKAVQLKWPAALGHFYGHCAMEWKD